MRKIAFLPRPLPFLARMWSWGVMTGATAATRAHEEKKKGREINPEPRLLL